MRIVFIADLGHPSASGHQRLWALKSCGLDPVSVNLAEYRLPYYWTHYNFIRFILRDLRHLYRVQSLESEIVSSVRLHDPDIVWFEWPRCFRPNFFTHLRGIVRSDAKIVSFQDDNPFGSRKGDYWMWKNYLRCARCFDLHLVKRQADVRNLGDMGAKRCRLWMHGVHEPFFYPNPDQRKIYDISFVGTCMDERAQLIEYLLATRKLPIHVFGNHWNRRSDLPRRFPKNFHPPVSGDDYADVIRQSKLSLCLVSHSNQDEWTMRTYEVPGCATTMLAERTPFHEATFAESKEALFFSSPEEAAEKIEWTLREPATARAIGWAAHQKCIDQGWTLRDRMAELFKEEFSYTPK